MKLLKMIKEEIVPLSRRQNIILLVIISSIFQFTLFFTPVLANEAANQAKAQSSLEDIIVINSPIIKDGPVDGTENYDEVVKNDEVTSNNEAINDTAEPILPIEKKVVEPTKKPELTPVRTSVHVITAYNSEAAQTDDSPCITANGFNVCDHGIEDTIAANFLKFGTKVQIPELFGDRIFIVRDRMNKKHPERVDVWMLSRADALKFGKRTAKIVVVE